MKYIASDKFILKKVGKNAMFIPLEGTGISMTKIFNVNELGIFIFELIKDGLDSDEIASKIADEYEVDLETATKDSNAFIADLEAKGIVIRG